jgi:DNA-binding beta-propeller fold protein YncE
VSDGKTVGVTARDSNALLGFSVSKLRGDPAHALIADVRVGPGPIGLTLASGDSRIVIADSNVASTTGANGDLAVVSITAGKPALLGVVPAGGEPRQLTLSSGGSVLLVTNQITGQLQVIKVADLP